MGKIDTSPPISRPVRTEDDAKLTAELNRVPDPFEVEQRIAEHHQLWTARFGLKGDVDAFRLTERIEDPGLIRAADSARRQLGSGFDSLFRELRKGNVNPGIGTKTVFGTIMEARGRTGARVYFRHSGSGIEVLALSTKGEQDRVIARLRELYST